MNIYIIVEIKYREFLSRLLVGASSAMNGNDVLIGDDEIKNKKITLKNIITGEQDQILLSQLEKSIIH